MKNKLNFYTVFALVITVFMSCSDDVIVNNYSIQSINNTSDGKKTSNFIYNKQNDIIENQSIYFCNKFIYNEKRQLIKKEIAVDENLYSSTIHNKSELMTSLNSIFTGYSIFEYNSDGKLTIQKYYFKKNNNFEYTSMQTYEYNQDKIVSLKIHNNQNVVTQYYTYEYDKVGNVSKEKYYSHLFTNGLDAKLISETSYQYDNKNNPFNIYKNLGLPGLYTNKNNIVESKTVLYEDVAGIEKNTTSKTVYEYNNKAFPIKINNSEEYIYN